MDLIDEILGSQFDPALLAPPAPIDSGRAAPAADKIRGMLLGVALGDALGAPHEFATQVPLGRYTGRLEHHLTVVRRFQGGRLTGGVGQVSDDAEMTIALASAICGNRWCYGRASATAAYLRWANSKCPFMGTNTRALFAGIRTARGFETRLAAKKAEPRSAWSQSNGCLMRAAPLAVLPESEWEAAAAEDCALTNFHPTCVDAVLAYVRAARALLAGEGAAAATARALSAAETPEVIAVIAAARDREPRDVTAQKGWVLHALHCAFAALNEGGPPGAAPTEPLPFQDRIDRVVRLGGDTDTNAAIAGALLGAQLGEAAMRREGRTGPNLAIMLAHDPASGALPRPKEYAAARISDLADSLAADAC